MRAVISGAGIAGLAAANALGRLGWEVVLLERAEALRGGGYMVDFFGPGYDAAEALGILPALRRKAHEIDAVDFVDGAGRPRSRIDYRLARQAANGKLLSIMRGDIEGALAAALPPSTHLRFSTTVAGVEDVTNGVAVTLSDGAVLEADLLVGADGIHSEVRRHVFGPESQYLRFLGFHTAAYFIRDETLHAAVRGQCALFTDTRRLFGLYDVGPGTVATFFVIRAETSERPSDPLAKLREVFRDIGWLIPATLAAAPEPRDIYYDVVAQVELPQWHRRRTVLIGDAAYAVSLLAGHGASLALAGGHALGAALAGADVPAGLQRVEAFLRPIVLEKQRAGRRTASWFVPRTRAHQVFRDVLLNLARTRMMSGVLARVLSLGSKGFSVRSRGANPDH